MAKPKQFTIVIEDTTTILRSKIFTATDVKEAMSMAEADEDWGYDNGWKKYDEYTNCELRPELCHVR